MRVQQNKPDESNGQNSAYWICQALGWGGYGLGYFLVVLLPLRQAGLMQAAIDSAYCLTGLLGTHLLRLRIKQHGRSEIPYRALIPRLLMGSLLVGLSQALLLAAAFMAQSPFDWNRAGQVFRFSGWRVVVDWRHFLRH